MKRFLPERQFTSVDELLTAIGEYFYCMEGPPMAYFELPQGPAHDPEFLVRFVYETFKERALPGEDENALLSRFWDMLNATVCTQLQNDADDWRPKPILFWRKLPQLEDTTDAEGNFTTRALYTRLIIPGYPLAFSTKEG